jgi:ferritin-like metal-binding protein YciE
MDPRDHSTPHPPIEPTQSTYSGRGAAGATGSTGMADTGVADTERGHGDTRRWSSPERTGTTRQQDGGGQGLQQRVADLLSIRSLDDLGDQVRANPLATIGVAVGVGFLLQRTRLLNPFLSTLTSGQSSPDLSPAEDRLLAWLNDAYALEKALIPVLKNHAEDARRRPKVRRRDLEHLEQTRRHAKKVKQCIEHLGAKPSKTKQAIGRFSGMMNSIATEPFDDEIVRNFLADFAAENLEIASYRALIVAAHEAGHPKIAKICQDILDDEEEMAAWLKDNLADAVHDTFAELGLHR